MTLKKIFRNKKTLYTALAVIAVWLFLMFGISRLYPAPAEINPENLEKLREIISSDPLFYDEKLDASFLHSSVIALKKADNAFLRVDRKFSPKLKPYLRDIYPENWRLWPEKFLATLPYIHLATEKFLNTGRSDDAILLLHLYKNAADAYKKAIELHIEALTALQNHDPENWEKTIVLMKSATKPEIVLQDFLLIRKNALALEHEINVLEQCLYSGICETASQEPDQVRQDQWDENKTGGEPPARSDFKPLPFEILGITEKTHTKEPVWIKTPCLGFDENREPVTQPFFIIETADKTKLNVKSWKKAVLADEQYYTDYGIISPEAMIFAPKSENTLRRQSATNDYTCTDLGYLALLLSDSKNKLDSLPHLIQNTLSNTWLLTAQARLEKQAFHPLYPLINRSAYSIYFATFSPAVWRIPDVPQFLLKEDVDARKGYTTYHDLISRGLSQKEIIKFDSLTSIRSLYKKAGIGN